jgi:hypothetical protein
MYDLNDCVASANSPIARVAAGLTNFTQIFQIAPAKLVLGGKLFILSSSPAFFSFSVPWYCYDYKCLSLDANMTCVCSTPSFSLFPFLFFCNSKSHMFLFVVLHVPMPPALNTIITTVETYYVSILQLAV